MMPFFVSSVQKTLGNAKQTEATLAVFHSPALTIGSPPALQFHPFRIKPFIRDLQGHSVQNPCTTQDIHN